MTINDQGKAVKQQTQLVVEPDDGTVPILNAIQHAKNTIDLTIFRFDRHDVSRALQAASARGVQVRALIALSHRGGVDSLRQLELRMLDMGATVARSSADFSKYHAKLMIVDNVELHVYGFNFTRADLKSRSFGVITTNQRLVRQASRLFDADLAHRPYDAGADTLVISPGNARERLEAFIRGACRELLIYDSRLRDHRILRILTERRHAGVAVRIIGHVGKESGNGDGHMARAPGTHLEGRHNRGLADVRKELPLRVEKMHHGRLHLRAIVRDGTAAFVGSQSLRKAELDTRRELGVFVHEPAIVRQIRETFEHDWPSEVPTTLEPTERVDLV
jgi:phosphatidylserine/phosphatidylglycerophosphate/cardiolipin synthase-like enzyme